MATSARARLSALDGYGIGGVGLAGERPAIVLDIGASFTKCGFANEATPRHIVRSTTVVDGVLVKVIQLVDQRPREVLLEILIHFIYDILYKYLLVSPCTSGSTLARRFVVVEGFAAPTLLRDLVAEVLYTHYMALSVAFTPAPLMALFSLGVDTALVVDAGHSETTVMAVYEGVPIVGSFVAVDAASSTVHDHIRDLLVSECGLTADEAVEVSDETLEDIKVRAVIAGRPPTGIEATSLRYTLPSGKTVQLNHGLRTCGCDPLFSNDDSQSIPDAILESIKRCPIDTRKALAQNICVCGGTAMLLGFRSRLADEVAALVTERRYAVLQGDVTERTVVIVELQPAGGGIDPLAVAGDRSRLVDELMQRLGDCQVSDVQVDVRDDGIFCTLVTSDDPDVQIVSGSVSIGQRSYTIHKVQKEQSPYNTGIAAALSFFDSLVPESIICWAGGAIFGALEFLSERSLSRDAYLKGESPHEWSKLGAGIAASSKSVDKPSTSASLRTAHQIPKDRPRAWGFGSLAVLDAPSLVP